MLTSLLAVFYGYAEPLLPAVPLLALLLWSAQWLARGERRARWRLALGLLAWQELHFTTFWYLGFDGNSLLPYQHFAWATGLLLFLGVLLRVPLPERALPLRGRWLRLALASASWLLLLWASPHAAAVQYLWTPLNAGWLAAAAAAAFLYGWNAVLCLTQAKGLTLATQIPTHTPYAAGAPTQSGPAA